jgi:hypothetical protein
MPKKNHHTSPDLEGRAVHVPLVAVWGLGPGRRLAGPARPRCQSGDYRTPSEMGESPEGGVRSMASGWDAVRQFARHGAIGHSRGVSLGAQREERGAQRGLGDRRPTYSRARRDTGASGAAFTWHRIGVQRNGQPKLWRRGDAFGCSLGRGLTRGRPELAGYEWPRTAATQRASRRGMARWLWCPLRQACAGAGCGWALGTRPRARACGRLPGG